MEMNHAKLTTNPKLKTTTQPKSLEITSNQVDFLVTQEICLSEDC